MVRGRPTGAGARSRLVSGYNVAAPYGILGFAPDPGEFGQVAAAAHATLADAQRRTQIAYPPTRGPHLDRGGLASRGC